MKADPTEHTQTCHHCKGTGQIKQRPVVPWGTWQQRKELVGQAKAGDRWIQIKSGRVAIIVEPKGGRYGNLKLLHENGRTTHKWDSYFAQEFTPETPPEVA